MNYEHFRKIQEALYFNHNFLVRPEVEFDFSMEFIAPIESWKGENSWTFLFQYILGSLPPRKKTSDFMHIECRDIHRRLVEFSKVERKNW